MARIIGVVLLLLCGTAMSATQKLTIDVKSTPNEWDSTGSGNKVAMLNDATDGNYIKSVSVSDTDRYAITNMVSLDTTVLNAIDSVKWFWKIRGGLGVGLSTGRIGIGVGSDYSEGTTRTFAVLAEGAWSSFTENFPSPPGSRGAWDTDEVDSAICQIRMVAFTPTEVPQVTSCSLVVYYADANPNAFFFTNNNGCETGSNFGKSMVRSDAYPKLIDTIKLTVPASTTDTDYFATIALTPNSQEWKTGPSSIYLNLIKQVNPDSLRVRLLKLDSLCGTIQDSTLWTPKQSIAKVKFQQTLDPDAKGATNQWDSTGTGTKLQMITDATDGNYIYSTNDAQTDLYTLENFSDIRYEFGDVIDSFKLFIKAQDNGAGTTRIIRKVIIGSDTTFGGTLNTTTSWVDYTMNVATPPGSRGTWDMWEIDSVLLGFESNVGASDVRITNCSTVVYITKCCVKINIDNHNWATGLCNDRLQVQFEWSNPAAASEDTIWFRVGSEAQSRLEHNIAVDVSPCQVVTQAACATQDSILADAEVAAFNQWANTGGANKTASITDATDGNYIFEVTNAEAQQFTFANQGIPANAIIDSIRAESWAQRTSGGSATRFTHRLMKNNVTTQYCDGTQKTLTTSWVGYPDGYKGSPTGGNNCQGIWTRSRLDSLNLRFIKNTGNEVRITRSVVYICYTVPSACEFTLNDENSVIKDAYMTSAIPTQNDSAGTTLFTMDNNTTLGERQSVIRIDLVKDSIVNRTVASANLRIHFAASGATTVLTYIRGLRRAWTESGVTWNNASSGVAWATAGAGDVSTDRYSDILDSALASDTNSGGFYDFNVTSHLQLCDGSDTANYKGWILTTKQNSGNGQIWAGLAQQKIVQIHAPQLTVNYCVAAAAPNMINIQVGQKRTRKVILTPSNVCETTGAQEFAGAGDFSADPVVGFSDEGWLWSEPKEWSFEPKVRVEITDVEDGE